MPLSELRMRTKGEQRTNRERYASSAYLVCKNNIAFLFCPWYNRGIEREMQAMTNEPKSFVMAMREYFGYKEGQTMQDFAKELKALNDADRAYFKALLQGIGYTITA